jgi:hypothetical protein
MGHHSLLARGVPVVLVVWLQPASPPRAPEGRIDRVATLETPRAAHTTTALPSGALLVAGGMNSNGGSLATAEIVDLSTTSVTAMGRMSDARAGHTATGLPDGRIVLAGGYNGTYLRSVEVFDPSRRRFTMMGEMLEGRSGHTATLLSDGRILFAGGVGDGWSFLSSAELFDPTSGQSEVVGSLRTARESHTATLLTDGRALIVGGHRGRKSAMEVYTSAEIYDPATRRFQPTGRLHTARHKHDAVRLADGRVLVLGGADRTDRHYYGTTEIYNTLRGTFEPGPTMRSTRYKFQGTSILLANGDVLVAAGAQAPELLDRQSLTFRAIEGAFPTAFFFASATPLTTGDVAIVGGYDPGNQNTGGIWRFRR